MQEESKRISFWVNSMHKRQLELLIRRFKKDHHYLDRLFESGNDAHIFPGVLEHLRKIFEHTHRNGSANNSALAIYPLALMWIHVTPINLNKAQEYLFLVAEECPHYTKAQTKLAEINFEEHNVPLARSIHLKSK